MKQRGLYISVLKHASVMVGIPKVYKDKNLFMQCPLAHLPKASKYWYGDATKHPKTFGVGERTFPTMIAQGGSKVVGGLPSRMRAIARLSAARS
jgi:hypothetical protein